METGTKISAGVHAVLVGWLFVGNIFRAEPLPMNVQDVSVISSEAFAAMMAQQRPPVAETQVAQPVPVPEEAPEAPPVQAEPEPQPQPAPPEKVAEAPQPEAVPEAPAVLPEAEVDDSPPEVQPPQQDVAVLVPQVAPEAVPQRAERVAPTPVLRPKPEAKPDPVEQPAVAPEPAEPDQPVAETPQEETAPKEAAPELVTEADEPARAPESSIRPRTRPERTVQTAQPKPEPKPAAEAKPEPKPAQQAAADPKPEAKPQAQAAESNIPMGPPMTGSEREGLKVAVAQCWNVGALSTEASETKVTVYVQMNRDGTPQAESIRLLSSQGGGQGAAQKVFDSARRAILRCGAKGFPLPAEKYGQWREIEMTFNPEGIFWK